MPQHAQPAVQLEFERSRLNDWLVVALFCLVILTPLTVQLIGFQRGPARKTGIWRHSRNSIRCGK